MNSADAALRWRSSAREQRRLGYHAPATALGINMHLLWVGVAADLWHRGDTSLEWILREAMAGEVFAAGHAERGNDLPGLLSTSRAERVAGGFRISGHKMFGTLAPVWTRYGLHAMWADAEGGPKIVHAFLPRDTPGYRIAETWDTLGMRATRSDDVLLEGAFIPDKYVARIVPAGEADAFVLGLFAWGGLGFANIYCAWRGARSTSRPGDAAEDVDRASAARWHTTRKSSTRSREMALTLDPVAPHIEQRRGGLDQRRRSWRGWPAKIVSAKYHAVEACWRIADLAMEVSGARECSRLTSSSGCSGTPAVGASIPRTQPGARDRRQDDTRHRSWRAAALGVAARGALSPPSACRSAPHTRQYNPPSPGSSRRIAAHPPAAGARAAHPPAPAARYPPVPSDRRTAPAGHSARA